MGCVSSISQVAQVVDTLPEAQPVRGVTSLDDELYVLRNKSKQQVEVYNITTLQSLRQLSVPVQQGVEVKLVGMTSCKHHRCLYITDHISKCVHRLTLNGEVTKWPVNYEPWGLSMTSKFNVLVTCNAARKLIEFTTNGEQLRKINLQQDIFTPWHAIEVSNGQFVVCHGSGSDPGNRVCIVDEIGHVTQSYAKRRGSATVGQLYQPCHVVADKDGSIFVADHDNSRVVLLSPTLNYIREVVSSEQLKWEAWRLFLDVDRRRLYVADSDYEDNGRVVVFHL